MESAVEDVLFPFEEGGAQPERLAVGVAAERSVDRAAADFFDRQVVLFARGVTQAEVEVADRRDHLGHGEGRLVAGGDRDVGDPLADLGADPTLELRQYLRGHRLAFRSTAVVVATTAAGQENENQQRDRLLMSPRSLHTQETLIETRRFHNSASLSCAAM